MDARTIVVKLENPRHGASAGTIPPGRVNCQADVAGATGNLPALKWVSARHRGFLRGSRQRCRHSPVPSAVLGLVKSPVGAIDQGGGVITDS